MAKNSLEIYRKFNVITNKIRCYKMMIDFKIRMSKIKRFFFSDRGKINRNANDDVNNSIECLIFFNFETFNIYDFI